MLTPDQIERCTALWRRLYARGAVRWMPGMAGTIAGFTGRAHRITAAGSSMAPWYIVGDCPAFGNPDDDPDLAPDWTDPATRGCLTAMAREATGDPALCARLCFARHADLPRWRAEGPDNIFAVADNEPEALLLAIEEAQR